MLIGCRNCGGRYSANLPACPHCQSPPPVDRTCPTCGAVLPSVPAPCAACAPAPARISSPVASSFDPARELRWAKSWAIACGTMILVGFLMPLITASAFGLPEYFWPWDWMPGLPILDLLASVQVALAAVTVLAAAILAPIRIVPRIMAIVGGVTLVLQIVLSVMGQLSLILWSTVPGLTSGILGGIALLSVCGIAVGNRVRKSFPVHRAPRRIAGLCGILTVAFLLTPLAGNSPIIAEMFEEHFWPQGWPFVLGFGAYLAYGIAGIVSFRGFAQPRSTTQVITWIGRTFFAVVPVVLLAIGLLTTRFLGGSGQEMFGPLILLVVKFCAVWYGLLALPSAGAAAWISASIGGGLSEPPPPPKKHLKRPVRAAGAAPPPPPDVVV
ncbi:MAG TPA: zinc ribbon domain-containing protein [Planctomycetota bacterium]